MSKIIDAEILEEGAVILSPFKDIDLTEGMDLVELMETYAEVPEIDPEADNAGELYQYALKGHKQFVKARNKIEKVRKILKAPALAFGKEVDSRAKELAFSIYDKEIALFIQRDKVEKNEQRKQDEAERFERERQMNIHNLIESIKNLPMSAIGKTSQEVNDIISNATQPTQENCEERYDEAVVVWTNTKQALDGMVKSAVMVEQAEEIQAEAEDKRKEEEAILENQRSDERAEFEKEKAEFKAMKAAHNREEEAKKEAENLVRAEREAEELERQEEEDQINKEIQASKAIESRKIETLEAMGAYANKVQLLNGIIAGEIPNLGWI